MEKPRKKTSRTLKIAVVIVIIIVASVGIFAALTYPRVLASFPVSLTIGSDIQTKEFDVPILHNLLQVEVSISAGTSVWSASIKSNDHTVWSHPLTAQTSQTTYQSEWIQVSSGGQYNFTFTMTTIGQLTAQVSVTSKGGFW